MRTWIIAAALAALALGPAARAQPAAPAPAYVSALCVWRAVPDPVRAQVLAAGPGVSDLAQALQTDAGAAVAAAADACNVPAAGQAHDDHAQALTFLVVEAWSAARLESQYGVGEASLRQAWANTPAVTRAEVLKADDDPTPAAAIAALAPMTASLDLTVDDAKLLVAIYASVRLHLAAIGEPG